jgi:HAD superfamily hydrolase (TIGR01509 family)
VRGFLASRGITLPEGTADDPADAATVQAIATRKNEMVLRELDEHGVETYPGSVDYLRAVKRAGLATAVVTASANGGKVIEAGGFADLVDVRIDGLVAARDGLRGKPEPDTFVAGARALGVEPAQAVVYEDALSGVAAGRAGGFGYVVGVDRVGQAEALQAAGADVVVQDLAELLRGEEA